MLKYVVFQSTTRNLLRCLRMRRTILRPSLCPQKQDILVTLLASKCSLQSFIRVCVIHSYVHNFVVFSTTLPGSTAISMSICSTINSHISLTDSFLGALQCHDKLVASTYLSALLPVRPPLDSLHTHRTDLYKILTFTF
jgi:hypothetical protein